MEEVKDTAQGTINVATGVKDDIIQLDFYKNPIFISFSIYIIVIFGIYFNMGKSQKNRVIYNNIFRDSAGIIHWLDILKYPYSGMNGYIRSPILLYLLLGIFFTVITIDPLQKRNQAYFYSVMFSYLFIVVLFTIHVIIFNVILSPEKASIELRLGDQDKVKKTYGTFYRTQWILLLAFSPIIIAIVIYIIRKLNKGKLTN